MVKQNVDKTEFYRRVKEVIGSANKSVLFSSVSCCWGFYSYGVKNFEEILLAIRDRAKMRVGGKYLDIKILVKIDADNPMDVFAADRLAAVQATLGNATLFSHFRHSTKRVLIF